MSNNVELFNFHWKFVFVWFGSSTNSIHPIRIRIEFNIGFRLARFDLTSNWTLKSTVCPSLIYKPYWTGWQEFSHSSFSSIQLCSQQFRLDPLTWGPKQLQIAEKLGGNIFSISPILIAKLRYELFNLNFQKGKFWGCLRGHPLMTSHKFGHF